MKITEKTKETSVDSNFYVKHLKINNKDKQFNVYH